ncbi:MAG TPA: DUF4105 domain-containing protein [Bacteroidales bacterium]|nr:DUF4105 domain-containing protein [Bacteroidales bacterium]
MKKSCFLIFFIIHILISQTWSQTSSTEIYLLTCDPGTESYSMYGHSALRVADTSRNLDLVYNWGVFDFSTPNFNYQFAKGRLDYMLGVYSYDNFLKEYAFTKRSVYSQVVNLDETDMLRLLIMINENAKPENRNYRYDFFMDNCATRIRDIFETILGEDLTYPDESIETLPTYRERLNEFLAAYPWLHLGIDLLIGSPGDDKCDLRGSMFLPDWLQRNLSLATVKSSTANYPLLGPVETVLLFDRPDMKIPFYKEAWFILSIIMLGILIITFRLRNRLFQNLFDLILFIVLILLSFLMVFTNFLTEHVAMGLNFNIIWLNPLWLVSIYALFAGDKFKWFWRTQIGLSLIFMILITLIKQSINPAIIPVVLIVIIRAYYRSMPELSD